MKTKGPRKISRQDILDGRMDYVTFCGVAEDIKLLDKEQRVDAAEFLHTLASAARTPEVYGVRDQRKWHNAVIVDTREPHEIEMGPKVSMGVNIPISRILRSDGTAEVSKLLDGNAEHDAVIFVCQQGNDSQVAAKKLLDWRAQQGNDRVQTTGDITEDDDNHQRHDLFIGDVIGGYAALEKV